MTPTQARRYARGLIDAAPEGADLEGLARELQQVIEAIENTPQLVSALEDTRLAPQAKAKLVKAVLELSGAAPLVRELLALVAGHGHVRGLGVLAAAVQERVDSVLGVAPAEIRSAQALGATELGRITQALEQAVGKRVRARTEVDPELLAGVVARVGDRVFDGSARRRLDDLRERLMRG